MIILWFLLCLTYFLIGIIGCSIGLMIARGSDVPTIGNFVLAGLVSAVFLLVVSTDKLFGGTAYVLVGTLGSLFAYFVYFRFMVKKHP